MRDGDKMPGAVFFPDARFNFAENLLRKRDDSDALVFWAEDRVKRRLSWQSFYGEVSRTAQAMRAHGIVAGDRIAGFMPNMPETIIAMLAASSIGAIWTSCSPDFGLAGVVDRFGQTTPRILFSADGYYYNGKAHDCLAQLGPILKALPSVEKLVVVPLVKDMPDLSGLDKAVRYADFTAPYVVGDIDFAQLPFNHPLYIMYSSGTTGKPKCIVHGAGGCYLTQVKEHLLHCDARPADRLFFFTTCGWMMWNWLVAGLASGACLLLYDGSPFAPSADILFDFADEEKMTFFGTSAKYIDALNKQNRRPIDSHDLGSVRGIASTGSPLVAESFDYIYRAVKADVQLASISGGTDILGCFIGGNPMAPVYRGEIQARLLGMAVQVYDAEGKAVIGEKGELVCTRPFPSMPLYFWQDAGDVKYRAAYFDKFPNVWTHGDFIALTDHGGVVVYGRSDTTLNPGGVRIGTAEIYRQVEQFPQVVEALVVGQDWDNDTRVILFVRLQAGAALDADLVAAIKARIRQNCTPRHVPAKVVAVGDIPRTKSGKITELAVRDIIHGRAVKNQTALANPDALALFQNLPALQS